MSTDQMGMTARSFFIAALRTNGLRLQNRYDVQLMAQLAVRAARLIEEELSDETQTDACLLAAEHSLESQRAAAVRRADKIAVERDRLARQVAVLKLKCANPESERIELPGVDDMDVESSASDAGGEA